MEDSMKKFFTTMNGFCHHLQTSCDALKQTVDRRPIPLDSASSTFINCLNRRVSSASTDLNLLETMAFGTVSLEELLGHCNEVYKKNESHVLELEDRLKPFGYVPGDAEIDDEDEVSGFTTPLSNESKRSEVVMDGMSSYTQSIIKSLEEDPLLDESVRLKKLGFSDFCLATLASKADDKTEDTYMFQEKTDMRTPFDVKRVKQPESETCAVTQDVHIKAEIDEASHPVIKVSTDDYESLPSYMKNLASWEDLLSAIAKINSSLKSKQKTNGLYYFQQDEIHKLGLGPKSRSYLLLLMRMNRFAVETIDGAIFYRVL